MSFGKIIFRVTMSKEEFAERMYEINEKYGDDPEMAHGEADKLMCECLKSLGYDDGVHGFERIEKWYA